MRYRRYRDIRFSGGSNEAFRIAKRYQDFNKKLVELQKELNRLDLQEMKNLPTKMQYECDAIGNALGAAGYKLDLFIDHLKQTDI